MESCCHDLCLNVALPVVGERRDHLRRELTTQVTVEDLRESEHCKYVTGEEVKEERRDRRRRGKRRNINQYGHTLHIYCRHMAGEDGEIETERDGDRGGGGK